MPKSELKGKVLDVRPDRLDLRDREYLPPLRSLPAEWPDQATVRQYLERYVLDGMILSQGQEGACSGFGLAAVINFLFWRDAVERGQKVPATVSPRMLYHLARFYDEWSGEDYQGSSCRGAMKGWHRHGACSEELWRYRDQQFVPPEEAWAVDAATRPLGAYYRINKDSVTDMQAAIVEVGAIYVSAMVHLGWFPPKLRRDARTGLATIEAGKSEAAGGHAFALVGYNRYGFIVQNSWGNDWGTRGFAVLPYEDWVQHSMDAWVAVMGVPVEHPAPRYEALGSLSDTSATPVQLFGVVKKQSVRPRLRKVAVWSQDQAYQHSIVMGNNGIVLNRSVESKDALASLERAVLDEPQRWLKQTGANDLVFYAHGGLNSEEASVGRIQIMAPYFEANGAYPVFFTWKTGFLDSLGNIVGDEVRGVQAQGVWSDILRGLKDAAKEARDRAIEVACQEVLVRAVWSQMKQNTEAAATERNPTLGLVAKHLQALVEARPRLRLHLVGHSAGSILFGHLLDVLRASKIPVATCTLFAPACSVRFAIDHYAKAATAGILKPARVHFEILSDPREQVDSVGPYGKSLLYLVSRALEDYHKTPLLGMANVWSGDEPFGSRELREEVAEWRRLWKGPAPTELTEPAVSDGEGAIPAAHGSFDNDVKVMTRAIERIVGGPLRHRIESLRGF